MDSPVPARYITGDAASFDTTCLEADTIVTSPPYWQQRDYALAGQLGQEETAEAFANTLTDALDHWRDCLKPHGSVFLNLSDTYTDKTLSGVPGLVAEKARQDDWRIIEEIRWTKPNGGMPSPVDSRLSSCHEAIFWLTDARTAPEPVQDMWRFRVEYPAENETVWSFGFDQNNGGHLAPFPEGLPARCLALAAPEHVCTACGAPARRVVSDAVHDALTAALRRFHTSADQSPTPRRELHQHLHNTTTLTSCDCTADTHPALVLDPFVGTGTTIDAALKRGCRAVGVDLDPPENGVQPQLSHYG